MTSGGSGGARSMGRAIEPNMPNREVVTSPHIVLARFGLLRRPRPAQWSTLWQPPMPRRLPRRLPRSRRPPPPPAEDPWPAFGRCFDRPHKRQRRPQLQHPLLPCLAAPPGRRRCRRPLAWKSLPPPRHHRPSRQRLQSLPPPALWHPLRLPSLSSRRPSPLPPPNTRPSWPPMAL